MANASCLQRFRTYWNIYGAGMHYNHIVIHFQSDCPSNSTIVKSSLNLPSSIHEDKKNPDFPIPTVQCTLTGYN